MNLLKNIFSIYNEDCYKIIKILGLKIRIKRFINLIEQCLNKIILLEKKTDSLFPTCCDFFYDYPNFSELYLNLIKDLDEKSIKTIAMIITRLKKYKETGSTEFILDDFEKYHLDNFRKWSNNIVKLNDDMYCYGKYILPINFFICAVFEARHDIDEITYIDPNKCIIDAGAFIGDSALIFSELTKNKVYCFEPTTVHYNNLCKTIEYNKLSNVVPVKMALSNVCGYTEISVVEGGGGSSIGKVVSSNNKTLPTEKISLTTLDSFVKENNLDVGIIKVDVEGAEQLFLEGAKETIFSQKPTLLISIYHNSDDFFMIKPLIESWNLGYKFKIRKDAFDTILCDTMLIAEVF